MQGFVKGFELKPYNEKLHNNVIGQYEGKQVEYCIREKKKKVSTSHHAYYRGVLLPSCMNAEVFGGWEKEEIHQYFANEFLKDVKTKEIKNGACIITKILSTSELTSKQMNEFTEKVIRWMEQENINVPKPELI